MLTTKDELDLPNTLKTKNIAKEPCFSFSSSVLGGSGVPTVTVLAAVGVKVIFPVLLLPTPSEIPLIIRAVGLLALGFENVHIYSYSYSNSYLFEKIQAKVRLISSKLPRSIFNK